MHPTASFIRSVIPASAARQLSESARAFEVRLSPTHTVSINPELSATGASRSSSGSEATPNMAARWGMIRPKDVIGGFTLSQLPHV